jgi:hypothetical protein
MTYWGFCATLCERVYSALWRRIAGAGGAAFEFLGGPSVTPLDIWNVYLSSRYVEYLLTVVNSQ